MINQDLGQEQEQRELQALDVINIKANSNTDLHSEGLGKGVLGEPAQKQYWGELAYREGYVTGITQHYDQKDNICLEQPF